MLKILYLPSDSFIISIPLKKRSTVVLIYRLSLGQSNISGDSFTCQKFFPL